MLPLDPVHQHVLPPSPSGQTSIFLSVGSRLKKKTGLEWESEKHLTGQQHIQGFQSADSIHAINLLTSGVFTVNTMWTH